MNNNREKKNFKLTGGPCGPGGPGIVIPGSMLDTPGSPLGPGKPCAPGIPGMPSIPRSPLSPFSPGVP